MAMIYDCSKILDFQHEQNRMCHMYNNLNDYVLNNYTNLKRCDAACPYANGDGECTFPDTMYLTQNDIDIVQKWSEEHPPMTHGNKILEYLCENGIPHKIVECYDDNNFYLEIPTKYWDKEI